MSFSLLGTGSPLLDIQLQVTDEFLREHVPGNKGGMEPVTTEVIDKIVSKSPFRPLFFPGGAAGNTVFALSRFGVKCALRGKLGCDAYKEKYFEFARRHNVDTSQLVISGEGRSGCCLALVTPDAERTMRSALGVSLELNESDIVNAAYSGYDAVLVEGFMAYSGMLELMVKSAKKHNCFVIFDLASFEIAEKFRELFITLMPYIDMVVANSSEAAAFTGKSDPHESLAELKKFVSTAVVKCGADGVLFANDKEEFSIPAYPPERLVDTTAAGDLWLAGYIYGRNCGVSERVAVEYGTMFSAKIIAHSGSVLTDEDIEELKVLLRR